LVVGLFLISVCALVYGVNGQTKMVAYYPLWLTGSQKSLALTDVPSYYTHINIAFGCFSGSSVVFQTLPNNLTQFLQQMKQVQARGQKVILTMGGWTCDWHPVYSDVAGFATKTYNFTNLYGFDGVDLDFEYMGYATAPVGASVSLINLYMRTLRRLLPASKPVILTPMPSYVNPSVDTLNDYNNAYIWVMNNISSILSWIQIMCYNNAEDQDPYQNVVNWSSNFTIHNYNYDSVSYYGYDPSKIVIGILATPPSGNNGYLTPSQVNGEIVRIRNRFSTFAGTMMWDIIDDYNNPSGQFYEGNGIKSCVLNNNC